MRGWVGRQRAVAVAVAIAAFAVCAGTARAGGGLTLERSMKQDLPAGETATATASCPKGASVTGGGVLIAQANTATAVHSSYPVDGKDADSKPDDAWRGRANSRSAGDKRMRVEAICSSSGRFRYVAVSTDVASPGQDSLARTCGADEQVAGGGGLLAGKHTGSGLAATEPYDNDADMIPDDGWSAAAVNTSGGTLELTAFAICARSGGPYAYVTGAGSAGAFQQSFATAICPTSAELTAGGGSTGTGSATAELAEIDPSFTTQGDRLDLAVNNLSGVPLDFSASAVCRG